MKTETTMNGRFTWHGMNSTDPVASESFYTQLFGWTVKEEQMPMGPYRMLTANGVPFGGVVPSQSGTSMWQAYVSIDDVDAAVARATAAGGRVVMPAFDAPGVGRIAVIADPLGGLIAPFCGEAPMPPAPTGEAANGLIVWNELFSTDIDAHSAFYDEFLGWTHADVDMGGMTARLMSAGETQVASVIASPCPDTKALWLPYVQVTDVDATAERVTELGGQVHMAPMDIPPGRIAVATDPQGATFGLFRPSGEC